MNGVLPRTATEIRTENGWSGSESKPLAAFRSAHAYVLIGDPGVGKTTAFRAEAKMTNGVYWTVRRFLRDQPDPKWRDKTLFLDALDEARAGGWDSRGPLDDLLNRLEALGSPKMRLSCRASDWMPGDYSEIRSLGGYAEMIELQLDLLDASAAKAFLHIHGREDADVFLQEADDRGLGELLANPLSLGLLADAVKDEGWPATRRDVFEMACHNLAEEHNDEHLDACGGSVGAPKDIVAAAAELSALLLLSGKEGVAGRRSVSTEDWPTLDDLGADWTGARAPPEGHQRRKAAKSALASKLFAVHRPGLFMPIHGQVAEFLAATHLSRRIEAGLPATRVLALMTDGDGGIVASLRGLAAWLACLCPLASADLVDCNPIGVLVDGDASRLTADGKRRLLRRLGEQPKEWREVWWYSHLAAATLVDRGTMDVLVEHLDGNDRSEKTQVIVEVLLDGIEAVCSRPGPMSPVERRGIESLDEKNTETLITTARDKTWPISIRIAALTAAGRLATDDMLQKMLDDVVEGRVSDENWAMRGALLGCLYPRLISPERIWDYLDEFRLAFHGGGGRYEVFWKHELLSQSESSDIRTLLDVLSRANRPPPNWNPKSDYRRPDWLAGLAWRLLARAVELHGERMSASELLRWLDFVAYDSRTGWNHSQHERSELLDDDVPRLVTTMAEAFGPPWIAGGAPTSRHRPIRTLKLWFAAHPDVQRAVYLEFLRKESASPRHEKREFSMLIFDRAFPADFPNWCLEQALEMHPTHPESACDLVEWAVRPHRLRGLPATWLSEMEKAAEDNATLMDHLHRLARYDNEQEARRQEANPLVKRKEDRGPLADLVGQARTNENALRRGKAPLPLLHALAEVYLGHLKSEAPDDSDDRLLASALDRGAEASAERPAEDTIPPDTSPSDTSPSPPDEALEWARLGLRGVLERTDLPSAEDLVDQSERGQQPYIALPILASIAMTVRDDEAFARLGAPVIRTAIACHFLYSREAGVQVVEVLGPPVAGEDHLPLAVELPWWFCRSLQSRPSDVADVFVTVYRSWIRSGRWHGDPLHDMARDKLYADVVMLAFPRLLKAFPTRCHLFHVARLGRVLRAAIGHMPDEVAKHVRKKVEAKGMDPAQRATWLAAGILVAPGEFTSLASEFVEAGRGNARARHLVDFLAAAWRRDDSRRPGRTADEVAHTTALLRALSRRFQPGWETDEPDEVIRRLMRVLAQDPTLEASKALDSLLDDEAVEAWHNNIERARDEQVALRRNVEYRIRIPSVDDVRNVLDNGPPANVADLAVLAEDRMRILCRDIRDGPTCDWKQYWNVDQHGRPERPKPETACRDAFASGLQPRLPEGVGGEIEVASSDGTRADMSCSYGGHVVPVEVKTNRSGDLWSAIDKQLIAKYTRIPESGGYGIYLVFWFGKEHTKVSPPKGRKPQTAKELENLLKQNLSSAQSSRIGVVVADVGDPRFSD